MHRDATCTQGTEVPNILKENWKAYTQRVKPILRMIREEAMKEKEQGVFLQGLEKLIASNTENIKSLFQTVRKREYSPNIYSPSSIPAKLTKPAKVPSWTKYMSLETWQEINEYLPDFAKYHELIEELKKNKDIKWL